VIFSLHFIEWLKKFFGPACYLEVGETSAMSIIQLFFGFKGRIKRGQYWAAAIAQFVTLLVLFAVLIGSLGMSGEELAAQRDAMNEEVLAKVGMVGILLLVGLIAIMWSAAAVYTKRLHDRNKGAVWLIAIYGPAVGSLVFPPLVILSFISNLWVFIELGCLPGTNGPNRFDDGSSQNAYLDDVFGKKNEAAPSGVGGMEAALAAINAAARAASAQQASAYPNAQPASPFGGAAPSFGRRAPQPPASGFGRRGL
jgi:uncharacterized membrane protein YhaH (DUF805 family)